MLEGKKILLDFDGTICNLQVDWAGLKSAVYQTFSNRYELTSRKLMDMVNFIYGKPDNRNELIDLIRAFEQPLGNVEYGQFNIDLLSHCNEFSVISNNLTDTVTRVLKEQNLLSRCSAVIGIDKVSESKPSIAPFLQLEKELGELKKSDCLYIGDSETDRLFAVNCNIKFLNVIDI